jgi:hypothetical protein
MKFSSRKSIAILLSKKIDVLLQVNFYQNGENGFVCVFFFVCFIFIVYFFFFLVRHRTQDMYVKNDVAGIEVIYVKIVHILYADDMVLCNRIDL